MTKEQFRAQFKYGPITFKEIKPVFSQIIHGFEIYRALQLLVLKDERGRFFTSRLK